MTQIVAYADRCRDREFRSSSTSIAVISSFLQKIAMKSAFLATTLAILSAASTDAFCAPPTGRIPMGAAVSRSASGEDASCVACQVPLIQRLSCDAVLQYLRRKMRSICAILVSHHEEKVHDSVQRDMGHVLSSFSFLDDGSWAQRRGLTRLTKLSCSHHFPLALVVMRPPYAC